MIIDTFEKHQVKNGFVSNREVWCVLSDMNNFFNEIVESDTCPLREGLANRLGKIEQYLEQLDIQLDINGLSMLTLNEQIEQLIINHIDACRKAMYKSLNDMCSGMSNNLKDNHHINKVMSNFVEESKETIKIKRLLSRMEEMLGKQKISRREREVLVHLLGGKSNKEISNELGITEKTVKNHLWRVYKNLEVKSRTQLYCYLLSL